MRIPAALTAVALTAGLASLGACSGNSRPSAGGPLRGGPFGAPSPGGADGLDARVDEGVTFGMSGSSTTATPPWY